VIEDVYEPVSYRARGYTPSSHEKGNRFHATGNFTSKDGTTIAYDKEEK
jgi:hypothetical protein